VARRLLGHLLFASVCGVVLVGAANVYLILSTRDDIVDGGVADAPLRPVAIVLGTRVLEDGTPAEGLEERLELALQLYRSGRVKRIIVSGAAHPDGYDEPKAMAAWLDARGVPATDVTLDKGGHRTAATMANAAAMDVRQALVSTQAYHLPRALYLARHAGIDALGVAAGDRSVMRERVRYQVRETLARAQAVVEVALFGVQVQ
jgi:SanA protein